MIEMQVPPMRQPSAPDASQQRAQEIHLMPESPPGSEPETFRHEPACPDDDAALALAAVQHRAAFGELYRRHVNGVYRYVLVHTRDELDAQDLTAQTFLTALERIRTYRGQGPFIAWLLTIARNKVLDHVRRARHAVARALPLDDVLEAVDPNPPPDTLAHRAVERDQLALAIRALNTERAEALVLRVVIGLSVEETSHVMNKSEAAVKMLVHRALADLRANLAGPGQALV